MESNQKHKIAKADRGISETIYRSDSVLSYGHLCPSAVAIMSDANQTQWVFFKPDLVGYNHRTQNDLLTPLSAAVMLYFLPTSERS